MEEERKKHISVIGSQEFTLGFRLAGVTKTFNPENYREKIQELIEDEKIGILVAKESDLEKLPQRTRKEVESSVKPVVVALSETAESERLKKKIKKAIGADITK